MTRSHGANMQKSKVYDATDPIWLYITLEEAN